MKASLIVAKGKQEGKVIPISVPQFVIGRHRECQLRAASATVGKHHCALRLRDEQLFVNDFDSVNGTFVNEERIEGERELHNEDCLRVGPMVFLIWLDEAARGVRMPAHGSTSSSSSEPDESAIAAMLLEESKRLRAPGILGSGEDSAYGSTVMKMPAPRSEANQPEKPKKSGKLEGRQAPAADLPEPAKIILERYKRRSN